MTLDEIRKRRAALMAAMRAQREEEIRLRFIAKRKAENEQVR